MIADFSIADDVLVLESFVPSDFDIDAALAGHLNLYVLNRFPVFSLVIVSATSLFESFIDFRYSHKNSLSSLPPVCTLDSKIAVKLNFKFPSGAERSILFSHQPELLYQICSASIEQRGRFYTQSDLLSCIESLSNEYEFEDDISQMEGSEIHKIGRLTAANPSTPF